jgi:hypothetical protein
MLPVLSAKAPRMYILAGVLGVLGDSFYVEPFYAAAQA